MTRTARSIIAGVDGSSGSRSAVLAADVLATNLRDRLVLAHALGDASERLADIADEEAAELLVVGARGRTGLAAVLLGNVSQRLVVTAGCQVLIVPPGAGERFLMEADTDGTIVCGVDGSEESRHALAVAERPAERLDLDAMASSSIPSAAGTTPRRSPSASRSATRCTSCESTAPRPGCG